MKLKAEVLGLDCWLAPRESVCRKDTLKKKKLPLSVIVSIVCCALLICSIIIAPNVCYVMTEQGVDSYVFVKTDSHAWEDIPCTS